MSQRVFVDYETTFSADYSLSFMTTREYILDPRFEVIGASIAVGDGPARWYDEADLRLVLATFDWPNVQFVAHNCLFDSAITQWHYGHRAMAWMDTMGMCQALLTATTGSAALKNVSRFVGRNKDSQALMNMKGKRSADIDRTDAEWERYCTYANEDVDTCRDLFNMLRPMIPDKEMLVMDTLLRMYLDNDLRIDREIVDQSLALVKVQAQQALAKAGIPDKSMLRSRDQFAGLLQSLGVTPPQKVSPSTGEPTYAFAKNDLGFTKLLDHENPRVVALVEAKLNASSSIEETRAQRFANLARIGDGKLNVPLRYSAAHTHRFGGSDRLNLQNLPRQSPLRDAIVAPEGHSIVVVDASQIEARMLSYMAKCWTLVHAFANGEDVYSSFATKIYRSPVNKKDHPDRRFVGKTGILGLGYGTGKDKFQWALLTSPFFDGEAPDDFCKNVVDTYRGSYPEIVQYWKDMDHALHCMNVGQRHSVGPVNFSSKRFMLPSGLPVQYPQLHWQDAEEWSERGYQYYAAKYRSFKKIYGAALTENVIQALSRIVITDAMLMMRATDPDYFCCLQVHDELGYLVPDHKAETCYNHLMKYMCTRPSWAPDLPLAAEGGIGKRYGDVK